MSSVRLGMNPNLDSATKVRSKPSWPLTGKEVKTKENLWEFETNGQRR